MNIKEVFLPLFLIAIIIFTPSNALAYLDPGSGGFIIQMLIALVASTVIFFKNGMMNVKNFFIKYVNFFFKKKNHKLDNKVKKD
jgi:hypothetical protein